jgi:hypothetical protein
MKKERLIDSRTKTMTVLKQEQLKGDLPEFSGLPKGAALIDVSVVTLRRWLTQKRLKRYKAGGHTLVKTAELLALVKEAK